MGYLRHGAWVDEWYDTAASGGRFVRQDARFRAWISPGGDVLPEPGRYHLYVAWACPWAHRTLIYRTLKGLEDAIGVTVVDPLMLSDGWVIPPGPIRSIMRSSSGRSTPRPIRITSAAPPSRCCGIAAVTPSSTTSRATSSACSTPGPAPAARCFARPSCVRDRCAERRDLSRDQQRRLSRRLRDHSGRLRGGLSRIVRDARSAGTAIARTVVPARRAGHRGGLAAVHHAGAVRRRLLRPFQVQSRSPGGFSRTLGLHARRSIRCRASPRRCGSTISRRTITAATAPSIRPASSRPARVSISPRRPGAPCRDSAAEIVAPPETVWSRNCALLPRRLGLD